MDSCNPSSCAKARPPTTTMMGQNSRSSTPRTSSPIDVEGINSRLNTMTMEERSQCLNDLHGIADTPDETPEMLKTKIGEMNDALLSSEYSMNSCPYRTALTMDAAYVERLKIPCLRATIFNSREAAALMIRFFGQKLDLFGEEKLVRDLRLSDLDRPGEMEALREKGLAQVLPHRDRSGRVIVLNIGRANQQYDIRVVLRVALYYTMAVCFQQDDETQKKGFVFLYFGFGQDKASLPRAIAYTRLVESIPLKIAGMHVCRHDDSAGNLLKEVLKYVTGIIDKSRLCRWRTHVGTHIEVMYSLTTFGIIKEAFKFTNNGELDLTNHHRMLDLVQKKEEETARDEADASKATAVAMQHQEKYEDNRGEHKVKATINNDLLLLGPMDILMGRGRHPTNNPATLRLHQVIGGYREKYDAGTKFDKQIITDVIFKQMKELGCRFLKETDFGYEECDDAVARSKISAVFRNARLRTRLKQEQKNMKGDH